MTHASTKKQDPLWYKDAVIYELHVKSFCDSRGDGMEDFVGLTGKPPYLQSLTPAPEPTGGSLLILI